MQRAIVVGGMGFLGLHTVRRLAQQGYRVFATHRLGKTPPALANVTWLTSDLAQPHATRDWPDACDHLIYLSQSRLYRQFPDAADDIFQVNVAGVQQALSYARRANVRSAVFASSGSVYTNSRQPVKETDVIDPNSPRNFYAATKLAAEILISTYNAILPVTQLRIFFPYGDGLGPEMLFASLIKKVREGTPIQLHGHDGLTGNPVHAGDVAETIERCLSLKRGAIYNLGGPETLSLRQIGETIGEIVGRRPVFECKPNDSAPVIVGDMTAMRAALGWAPATRFADGLRMWLGKSAKAAA
jgi:nucleoside-diphosphate-sugar epimerase